MKVSFTQQQLEFFSGCMLGDGNMKITKGSKNAMFSSQHSHKQSDYNKWKYEILKSLGGKYYEYTRKTPNKKTGLYYKYNVLLTNCNPNITEMYNILYKEGKKKITKELLKNFTLFSLAVLYMDDGSLTRQDVNSSYTIASCNFDKESLDLFIKFLFDKWNIESTITYDNRIYIKMNSRNLFEYLILPYVKEIPSMMYKLRKEMSRNSVNCLETPEEGNQQPSSCGDTEKGSTTSSESQVDNNSTTKAGQMSLIEYRQFLMDNQPEHLKI